MAYVSAHPALLNAEIVSIICQSLDPKSLWHLAQTATFLLDPSLNELWRDLSDITYLLFPFKSSFDPTETNQDFPSVPSTMQWDRFSFYARRVRRLHIMGLDHIELGFFMLSPQRPLLPHLQSLVAREWSQIQTLCNMSIFFSDSLREFEIQYDCQGDVSLLEPLIATLAAKAPGLKDLEIGINSHVSYDFGRSISLFRNLRYIDIPLIGSRVHSILSHLSTIPTLSILRFDIISLPRSHTASIYTFPVALDLQITSKFDTECMNLLAITRFENLTNLGIYCPGYQIEDDSLFNVIAACCGQSLKQIDTNDEDTIYEPELPLRDATFTLCPLYKFTNLSYLSLVNQFQPTDEEIEGATRSWPKLNTFIMRLYQFEKGRYSPLTLAGLLILIEGCTSLVNLSIAVDARTLPDITNRSNPIVRPGLSIEICHFYSPLTCPVALANFFGIVLSDALIEVAEDYDHVLNYKLWKLVEQLYPYFVRARREERERVIKQYVQELKTLV